MALTIQELEQLVATLKPSVEAKKQARIEELTAQVGAEIAQTPEAQQIARLEAEIAELQTPQAEVQEETPGTEEVEQTQEQPEETQE